MSSSTPTQTQASDIDPIKTPSRRRGKLLIVDDEEGPRQSLRVIFKDDYDILMADGRRARDRTGAEDKIDVAVLDIRMAGMSGIEVLERLKYVDPAIEVVMMTAFETTDTMRQALRLRACDYINKPFDVSTMRAAVANAMQRRTLESEIHNNAEKLQQLLIELQNQKIEEQIANTRGEIYASIIHDINGPLTVISGFVQLMNQRFGNATELGSRGSGVHQGPAEDHHPPGHQLHRDFPPLPQFPAQATGRSAARGRQPTPHRSAASGPRPSQPAEQQLDVHPLAEDIGVKMNGTDLIQILLNLTVNAFQCSPQSRSGGRSPAPCCTNRWT